MDAAKVLDVGVQGGLFQVQVSPAALAPRLINDQTTVFAQCRNVPEPAGNHLGRPPDQDEGGRVDGATSARPRVEHVDLAHRLVGQGHVPDLEQKVFGLVAARDDGRGRGRHESQGSPQQKRTANGVVAGKSRCGSRENEAKGVRRPQEHRRGQ